MSLALVSFLGCRTAAPRPEPEASAPRPAPSASPVAAPRVVVVGAGLAGLTAAYTLEKHGVPIHLLEANATLGGRVQTAYYDGMKLHGEYGMQELWEGNPLLTIMDELGVERDEQPEEPYSSLLVDGNLIPFVQETTEAYFRSFLSEAEHEFLKAWMKESSELRGRLLAKTLPAEDRKALESTSFGQWVRSADLPFMAREWIRLTLECELASGWNEFSAAVGLLEFGVFFGGGVKNYHVKGGNSKVIEAMGASLRSPITTSALVTGVKKRSDGRLEVTYVKDQIIGKLEAERVILAIPFFRLHALVFEPALSEARWEAIQTLQRGHYTVVHFAIRKGVRDAWSIGGESPFPVLSDGALGVIYGVMDESAPEQTTEIFTLLVYGEPARAFHMVPRNLKIETMQKELEALFPGFAKAVVETHIYTYHPGSLPVWPPGRSPLDEQAALLRTPEHGIYFAGDYTEGAHSDGAVRSGLLAAELVARDLGAR